MFWGGQNIYCACSEIKKDYLFYGSYLGSLLHWHSAFRFFNFLLNSAFCIVRYSMLNFIFHIWFYIFRSIFHTFCSLLHTLCSILYSFCLKMFIVILFSYSLLWCCISTVTLMFLSDFSILHFTIRFSTLALVYKSRPNHRYYMYILYQPVIY